MTIPFSAKTSKLIPKILSYFEKILFQAQGILSPRSFIYLSSVLVAVSCSLAVIVLKAFAHNVFIFANYVNTFFKIPFFITILPVIGIILTVVVVKNFLDGTIEKGSVHILHAVAKKRGNVPRKQMYAQIITSSLTVGLGGSAGLESPIVITGAAFGSNYAQKYKLSLNDRILLLACGVSAGIGAAFNAPIAGVLFAIEVILTDVSISAFIPIIISAATGSLVSQIILDQEILLKFKQKLNFDFHNTPYYIVLGVLAGFFSIYHARNFRKVEHYISHFRKNKFQKAIFGAVLLSALIFIFPPLFGEGYESIKTLTSNHPEDLLNNTIFNSHKNNQWILLVIVGVIALMKSVATGLTLGSGGNGGNFAPSLFVGSYLGFFVAKIIDLIGIKHNLPIANFTIVGMAGILSGLFHAPLTSIFLIGEITGGYDLMVPLMIVSSISFAISKRFEKHSMDVKNLADSGAVFTNDKDRNILVSIDFLKLIDVNFIRLNVSKSLETYKEVLASSNQLQFPVEDDNNNLVGFINANTVKPILFNAFQLKYTSVKEIIQPLEHFVSIEEDIEIIFEKFEQANLESLPVFKDNKLYGFISKLSLLQDYRKKLQELTIE